MTKPRIAPAAKACCEEITTSESRFGELREKLKR
jgi:hypothetical protein